MWDFEYGILSVLDKTRRFFITLNQKIFVSLRNHRECDFGSKEEYEERTREKARFVKVFVLRAFVS